MEGQYETDLSSKRPVDLHVQSTLTFIQRHEEDLHRISENNSFCHERSFYKGIHTSHKAVRYALDAPERVTLQDTLARYSEESSGENFQEHTSGTSDQNQNQKDPHDFLQKVLIVLVFLADEVHELKEIAEERLFPSLVMFGKVPVDDVKGKRRGFENIPNNALGKKFHECF